jgi:hypothetical protein
MDSVEKIIYLIKSKNYTIKEIENVIIEEIKIDRNLIVSEIEKRHNYGFEDVSDEVCIKLRKQWNSNKVRT